MRSSVLALVGLATLFVGWVLGFVMPGIRIFSWAIVALGAALIASAAVLDFRRVTDALSSRRGILGIGTTVSLALVLGIILLANGISARNFHRFDFTGLSQFTLTSQTKEVLAELDEPVEIVTFFSPAVPAGIRDFGTSLLAEYEHFSDQLTVRGEDPELRPDLARQFGITRFGATYGTVVFRGADGQRQVYGPQIAAAAEHAFTSAILEVTGTRQRLVYFLTGHGEHSVGGDLANALSGLRDNLFAIAELDLLRADAIPEDAAALVLAGPQRALASSELNLLHEYLQQGGRLLVLLDPDPQPGLRELLARWWLNIEDGILVDPTSHVSPNLEVPLVDRNRNSYQLAETYFPGATMIGPGPDIPDQAQVAALVWTTPDAWLERLPLGDAAPRFDADRDRPGPLAIGALVSAPVAADATDAADAADAAVPAGITRLAVVGDSDFATNQHFHNGNNSDLFLTAVNWLAEGDQIISVDRKVLPVRRLVLTPEEARFLNLSSVGLLPLLLVVAAGIVWWRRR